MLTVILEDEMLNCPRDGSNLQPQKEHGIEVDACPTCKGEWYDFGELEALEATAAGDADDRAGTIEYAKRESALACPVCGKVMVAFDYRGNNLELDACGEEHGFWLDAGEAERIRDLMKARVNDLRRSASAQRGWNRDREGGFKGGIIDRIRDLFSARR